MAERADYLVPRPTPTWNDLSQTVAEMDPVAGDCYRAACFAARLSYSDDMCLRFSAFVAMTGDLVRPETWPARLRQLVVIRDKAA